MKPALCRECSAGIYEIALDPTAEVVAVELKIEPFVLVGHVVVNPVTGRGRVLEDAHRDSGAVYGWLERGAQMHAPHAVSCSGPVQRRNQEAMF
jgi:hypothetical protein